MHALFPGFSLPVPLAKATMAAAAAALLSACLALPAGAAGTDQKAAKPAAAPVAEADAPPLLPGGASALSETYEGWSVNCQVANKVKACSMSHQQVNKNTGQRLLAVEIAARSADEAAGTIVLPFGLAVSQGVTLAVDDQKPLPVLPFSTCLSGGCLVPARLDRKLLQELSAAESLKIVGTVYDTGQPITFTVPLAGFSAALARTVALSM